MPPKNNGQSDSILDWLPQTAKPKDWMDVAQETATQQTAPNPFGAAGGFAPEESGVWEPGLMSLLPTSPIDLAVETILAGVSQDHPELGIALGLLGPRYGPKIAKGINVRGGAALSRRQYRKGFKRAKGDPTQKEIPFESESQFFPFAGRAMGSYYPLSGVELIRHGSSGSGIGKPFRFAEFTLMDMLKDPSYIRRKAMQSTVAHEGRHYLQHKASPTPWDLRLEPFEGVVQKPKKPVTSKQLTKEWGDQLGTEGVEEYKKYLDYVSKPIEVEARLEQIASFGTKNSPTQIKQLKQAGYTDNQINAMLKDYTGHKELALAARKIASGFRKKNR